MDDDLKFKHHCTSIISGPTCSGKSSICKRLLQNLKSLCTEQEFNGGTFWCYRERTAVPDQGLCELNNTIRVHKGVPENFENKNGKPCLIILDGLLDVAYSKEV
jgi:cytidylate kinase